MSLSLPRRRSFQPTWKSVKQDIQWLTNILHYCYNNIYSEHLHAKWQCLKLFELDLKNIDKASFSTH